VTINSGSRLIRVVEGVDEVKEALNEVKGITTRVLIDQNA